MSTEARAIDDTVVIALPAGLGDGTYTVTWQVISADSHRISGASVFHVGAPSAGGGAVVAPGADDVGWGVRFGASALSAVAYAGALIGVGGWWWRAPGRSTERSSPAERRWRSVVVRAMVLGASAIVAALPVPDRPGRRRARRAARRRLPAARRCAGRSVSATAVTAVGLLVTASARHARGAPGHGVDRRGDGRRRPRRVRHRGPHPLAAPAGADDRLRRGPPRRGGVLDRWHRRARRRLPLRRRRPIELGRMVARFSTAAVVSVVVLAIAGVGMSWIVLPSLGRPGVDRLRPGPADEGRPRGRRRRARRLQQPPAGAGRSAPARRRPVQRRRLARIVQVELVLLLAVVAVTAVLVARSPVPSSSAAPPPSTVPADAVELPLSGRRRHGVATRCAPGRAGTNELRLMLLDAAGQPLDPGRHADRRAHRAGARARTAAAARAPARRRRLPRHRRDPDRRQLGADDPRPHQRLRGGDGDHRR